MRKLLIAQNQQTLIEYLDQALHEEWEIHACMDSYPVLDMLQYLKPEGLIFDLNLGPKNGLAVLNEARDILPPATIATTNLVNDQVLTELEQVGVNCLVRIPFRAEYIKEQLNKLSASVPHDIVWHLRRLGFNPKLSGYWHLVAAISVFASNTNQLMKEVYPAASKLYGYPWPQNMERTIRTAIYDAWAKRSLPVWTLYFPVNCHRDIDKPSNKEFIARIAQEI